MNNLKYALSVFCVVLFLFSAQAQYDSTARITRLSLETRMSFDFSHQHIENQWNSLGTTTSILDTNTYGFNAQYLNFVLAGNFGKHFSYFYRQRIISAPGNSSFLDNTDFLYLTYHINDRFALTFGKQVVNVGGYEYDAPPIDVFYSSEFWANVPCYQLGIDFSYTDKQKKNTLHLQVANSPYLYRESSWQNRFFGKGLLAYSFTWYGNFNHFHTIYSVNMLERERGKFINYVSLGNKLSYDKWSIYVDYMNRAASTKKFFSDFTIMSRVDVKLGKGVSIFAKGGYEQNLAQEVVADLVDAHDFLVSPGHQYGFGGLGLVYRPRKCSDVRFHAFVVYYADMTRISGINSSDLCYEDLWRANMGVTWNINFLHYIQKIREKRIAKSLENNK